jgi:hypothetical protein
MPSARRLTTLVGAAFVGLAATALIASPASAHNAFAKPVPTCETKDGKSVVKVTWTVTQDWTKDFTFKKVTANPMLKGTDIANDKKVKPTDRPTAVQWVKPGDTATLSFDAVWKDLTRSVSESVKTEGVCKPECPPSIDAQRRNDGKGDDDCKPECPGVEIQGSNGGHKPPTCSPSPSTSPSKPTESGSPSPSHSTSASPSPSGGTGGGAGSPSPSKSATAPALPVTGAQTGLLAGGALVLLGAGAGMFFLARRRRLKFEA